MLKEQVKAKPRYADGTPEAAPGPFESLFRAEYPRVVAVANRVLDDRAEAEDVAQEVFWDLHRRHPEGMPLASRWLARAAVHTALNRLRGRRRRERRERQAETAAPPDPESVHERAEERRLVREALARLPTKKASVLALRYSGLSYAEVAAALGVTTGQVGTLLRRAEAALVKEVSREASR